MQTMQTTPIGQTFRIDQSEDRRRIRRTTRTAGILYLAIFVLAPFAFLVGRAAIIAPGDAATTAANVVANETLFRVGMVAEVAVFLIEVVMAGLLYAIFRPVSRSMSLAAAFGRLGEAAVQAVNLVTGALALIVASGAGYLAAFAPEQLDALVQISVEANDFLVIVWGLFFAVHLMLLGILVARSGFMPGLLGWLLVAASFGYFAESVGSLLGVDNTGILTTIVMVVAFPSELAFALWLLIKGVDVDAWIERSDAPSRV
jgi:hypothetical protein